MSSVQADFTCSARIGIIPTLLGLSATCVVDVVGGRWWWGWRVWWSMMVDDGASGVSGGVTGGGGGGDVMLSCHDKKE